MAVEGHLGLVVDPHVTVVQRPPEIAEQAEPLRRVGVLLRLVHLDAAAAALGMGHGDVGPAQKRFSIGRVVR